MPGRSGARHEQTRCSTVWTRTQFVRRGRIRIALRGLGGQCRTGPDRRSHAGGRRARHACAPAGGAHRPQARVHDDGREPAGGEHRDRDRPGVARRGGRQHAAARRDRVRHQFAFAKIELRSADRLRADLPARKLADGDRRQECVAVSQPRRPVRSGTRQARRSDAGEHWPRIDGAHRIRNAQARGQGRHDVRPISRHRSRGQRADGGPCYVILRQLRGCRRASQGGHAARARQRLAGTPRAAARPADAFRAGLQDEPGRNLVGLVAPTKTPKEAVSRLAGGSGRPCKSPRSRPSSRPGGSIRR